LLVAMLFVVTMCGLSLGLLLNQGPARKRPQPAVADVVLVRLLHVPPFKLDRAAKPGTTGWVGVPLESSDPTTARTLLRELGVLGPDRELDEASEVTKTFNVFSDT
jgi:hypothetical protein